MENLPIARRNLDTAPPRSAATEEAEHEYAAFFDLSPDLMCIADFDGRLKRLNPAWTARLGWSRGQLEDQPFVDFVHPDDREATLVELGVLVNGADAVLFENRCRHRDGSYRRLQWHARPRKDRRQICATARDVTRQRELEVEILQIVDRERNRLGQELHDGLGQTLAGIAALGSSLSRRLVGGRESAAAAEITQLLNDAISETRDLARGFGPVGLAEAGLGMELGYLAVSVQHRFRVSCELTCDRLFPRLADEVEAHLFRVAQEAVSNAVAHGRPERIEIGLSSETGEGLLSVLDDGVGLGEEASDSDGLGLRTMAYRAHLIGGRLEMRRRQRGTAVTCSFPLHEVLENTHETV